jgi:hypothetical protein
MPREAEGLYTQEEWSEFIRQLNAAEEELYFPLGQGASCCIAIFFRQYPH